jgi:predicted AlkP superfamily phosphohydrolase/phosphomutase
MTARALVIGLDGADVDVIQAIGRARLPFLHAAMERGAWARLESVMPPATLPNWTTFLTGVDPGRHGVFDFATRHGYRVAFTAGTVREAPTIAARLDRMGLACACVGFPATWPPEPLANGIFISGWDSPVAFEADRSFVWPRALHAEIAARFGPMRFDDVDEFDAGAPGWYERLPAALEERIAHKTELASWLLERRPWDLFAFYFGESDTASHHLYAHWDERSPRHPVGTKDKDGLARVYAALDEAVARITRMAGPQHELTIVSDHGSGGAGDRVLYLNRALESAGLLTFRGASHVAAIKDLALTVLPPRARQLAFHAFGRALPGFIESRARFAAIDFDHTRAFSDELNYFPSVSFNLRGREPRGVATDRAQLIREVTDVLLALRDPWTHAPVVRSVWPREELYEGPHVDRAPDLLLDLFLDPSGYSVNVMPSSTAPGGTGPWRRLSASEYLGRKGRSLPGSHRPRGLYIADGPSVRARGEVRARIGDATATVLARLGIAPSPEMCGRVLREVLHTRAIDRTLPAAPSPSLREGDRYSLERRLRALGYLD